MFVIFLCTTIYANNLPFLQHEIFQSHPIRHKPFDLMDAKKGDLLDLSFAGLNDDDMPAIVNFLKKNPEVSKLNLSGNEELSGKSFVPLASIASLKEIDLSRNSKHCDNDVCFGGLNAQEAQAFAKSETIKSLDLTMHSIGNEGAKAFAKNKSIQELNLRSNEIDDEGGSSVAQSENIQALDLSANYKISINTANAISRNKNLVSVVLRQTNIQDAGAILLAKNTSIINLDVSLSGITDIGATALAKNEVLRELDLCMNAVSEVGALELSKNRTLTKLSVCPDFIFVEDPKPRIGDVGASYFAKSTNLISLDLTFQSITDKGVKKLLTNRSLEELNISANPLSDQAAYYLMNEAPQLKVLWLAYTNITDLGAASLAKLPQLHFIGLSVGHVGNIGAKLLSQNTSIETLLMDFNLVQDSGAIHLVQNSSLKNLDVSFNCMTEIGNKALENSKTLRNLSVGGTNLFYDCEKSDSFKKISNNQVLKPFLLNKNIFYRTKTSLRCIGTK